MMNERDMLADVVVRHRVRRVAILLYTADPWTAATFHDAVVPLLRRRKVTVVDVIRVGPHRFHSACDPDDPGTAYDLKAHPFTAERVVAGRVVHHSRAELAASLDPAEASEVAAVEVAARAAAASSPWRRAR